MSGSGTGSENGSRHSGTGGRESNSWENGSGDGRLGDTGGRGHDATAGQDGGSKAQGLAVRSTAAERMDTDCVDYEDYRRCLRDLARVNTVTFTYRPTLAWLARVTKGRQRFSLVDVASGHGDGLRRIAAWAARRGLQADLTGVDLNPWAVRAASDATSFPNVRFINADVFEWRPGVPPDFIISSQFTHHLTGPEIVRFLRWMDAMATRGWFIGDLHRHWLAYQGFPLLARAAFWHRFVRYDGRISIARSFRMADWHALLANAGFAPGTVAVAWNMPFRICLSRDKCQGL